MDSNLRTASRAIVILSGLFLIFTVIVAAQNNPTLDSTLEVDTNSSVRQQAITPNCPALAAFYTSATDMCLGKPDNYACNGGLPPNAEPAGPVSSSLSPQGALVDVDVISAITTSGFLEDGHSGGLLWLRVQQTAMRALMLGHITIQDVTPQTTDYDFPAWTSIIVVTSEEETLCADVPQNSFVVQSNVNFDTIASTRIVINGASIDLRGTLVIQTHGGQTYFIAVEGEARVISNGQTQGMVAGQQIRVSHENGDFSRAVGTPGLPEPLNAAYISKLPVALFDRATLLPQPGYVTTDGIVNMRASPSLGATLLYQISPGQIMTILGRNPDGDWFHVQLPTGETGWMFAELLNQNHGEIANVYSLTPVPPQRFGDLGKYALVTSSTGTTMRSAPDTTFRAVLNLEPAVKVNLLARSPYSPWVKVDASGAVGWVALIALETQAIISSLPIDYNVPPPPTPPAPPPPTRVPGSWGGAFPDPNCFTGSNCN